MAKGYSVRVAENYTHHRSKNGQWRLHSSALWDDKGNTLQFPTVEEAEKKAREIMNAQTMRPDEQWYIQYCKIYKGSEYIKTVEREA